MDPFVQFVIIPFVIVSLSVGVTLLLKRVWVAPILAFLMNTVVNYVKFQRSDATGQISREQLFEWSFVTALIATIFALYLFLSMTILARRRAALDAVKRKETESK